jgi:hypothetical protein
VCILLSDGKDTASEVSRQTVMDGMRTSHVTVFSIGLFRRGEPDTDARFLDKLSREFGGAAFFEPDPAQLTKAFDAILNDLRTRYLLGFLADGSQEGGKRELHRLTVRARDHSGRLLATRARRNYLIGGGGQ